MFTAGDLAGGQWLVVGSSRQISGSSGLCTSSRLHGNLHMPVPFQLWGRSGRSVVQDRRYRGFVLFASLGAFSNKNCVVHPSILCTVYTSIPGSHSNASRIVEIKASCPKSPVSRIQCQRGPRGRIMIRLLEVGMIYIIDTEQRAEPPVSGLSRVIVHLSISHLSCRLPVECQCALMRVE